jgi:hypothetical protein
MTAGPPGALAVVSLDRPGPFPVSAAAHIHKMGHYSLFLGLVLLVNSLFGLNGPGLNVRPVVGRSLSVLSSLSFPPPARASGEFRQQRPGMGRT